MSGCLVIGTKVGGIEDIIDNGETGYLIPPGNSDVLAVKIIKLIAAYDQHNSMRQRGREKVVRQFDWDFIAARYSDAYFSHL